MLINIYGNLFIMSVIFGGLYLILKLLSSVTLRFFSALGVPFNLYQGLLQIRLIVVFHMLQAGNWCKTVQRHGWRNC